MLEFCVGNCFVVGILFFIGGIVVGRLGAVLVSAVQDDSGQIKVSLGSFFLKCQKNWGWIPLTSWVNKQNGGSRSVRPFFMELVLGVLFASLFYKIGWEYVLAEYLIFAFGLVTVSAVDLERMILPDFLTLSGVLIGLGGALLNPTRNFLPALFGGIMGGGFLWIMAVCYYAFRKEDGLGGGDIKLLAWIGTVLTWKAIPIVILLSCLTGLLASVTVLFSRQSDWFKSGIPFGPHLSLSALVSIFCGERLANWYLSFFLMPILY